MCKSFLKKRLSFVLLSIGVGALCFPAKTLFAGQGVQRMLYSVPNSTFIENPSGDSSVVTINDTSGSISSLQTAINNARSANSSAIIVAHLLPGATYTVNSSSLVLGANECLVGSGAIIQAASSSVTVPLIQIASGSTEVSVAGGTLNGNGAAINAIQAPSASRVNIDKVVVQNCGLDGILLNGNGNTTYDNEMTVTRCDVSGCASHAGINIQNATQAVLLDNNCHNNSTGILLSCAWANVANNSCNNNTTGIDVSGGDDNVIANNTCTGNATGIHVAGTKNMIVSNQTGNSSTAGISSTGSTGTFIDNLFASGNAVNFSSGGTSDNIIAYKAPISASSENYFYPPLIDNQHTTTTIVNGKGRTDLTIGSTSIDSVQSQYNTAMANNPNNVIVLHLNGTFTVGANPLTLSANTCVLLNGTIQINSSTTASSVVTVASGSPAHISISGGTIDGGGNTGITGISVPSASMLQVDGMTIQNLGTSGTRVTGSDAIHFSGGSIPLVVTRCTINGSAARGIWTQLSSQKPVISDNEVTAVNMDGVDCDSSTFGAVVKFNYCHDLVRYGVFIEQSAQHDLALGNVCNNDSRDINLENNSTTARGPVQFNTIACNNVMDNNGLRNGAGGDGTSVVTSDNFFFNNTLTNATITSEQFGSQNYYSQNFMIGGSIATGGAEVFFNSPDASGNLQIRDSNSGLGVIVQNASTSSGAAVVTASPVSQGNGTTDDEWQLIPTDSGYYRIMNENSGLAMVVQGASAASGAPIVQTAFTGDGTHNDEWQPVPTGTGLYSFVNRLSGLYLDVPGGSTTQGTQLDQATSNGQAYQHFSLVEDTPSTTVPDYSISATPASQSVTPGNGTSYTVTVTATNGFNGSAALTVSGLPAGASASFNPTSITGSGTSTMTVTTSGSTPAGTYTLTITGTSGSLSHSTTVTFGVMDFTITATPGSQTVVAGNSTNYAVTVGNVNGFSGTVTFSAGGLPSGATASFVPTSVNSLGSSTMTVATTTSTTPGTYTVTVTGTSGSLVHSANVTLIINPPPTPTFSLSASPSSLTIVQGANGVSTITVNPINGFNGSVSLSASGLPSGVTASFNPSSTTTTSTLTLSASSTAATGTATVTVIGISGSLSNTTTISLTVQASASLPPGWTDIDIGAVGLAGSATYNNGTFTVSGSGSDIWTAADQFNYVYQSVSGDQTVIARVVSENGNQSYAKAGVMIRETLATNAVEASVLLTPANGVALEIRPTTGASSINVVGWVIGPVPPQWVKLVRSGSTFSASYSPDGNTWTQFASTNVTMAASSTAGLAVTSHSNTNLNTAKFDNVSIVGPVPDFTISATPSSQTVIAGNGTTYTVTVGSVNGYNGNVSFSVSGLPTGASGSFNPGSVTGSGSSTLNVSTTTSTAAGTYTLTITGTDGTVGPHSTTVTLVINPTPLPDFTISATPSSQTVTAGNSTNYTVTVGALNGFNSSVSFSVSGLPTGASASFNPTSVTGSGSSTMTVSTATSTSAGTYTLTITGTDGTAGPHSANVTLVVNPAPVPNFSLSASPNSLTVVQGANGSSTITVNPINGFNGSVSLSASGLPSGVTATFNPASTTTTSTLTLSASSTAATGTATVTIIGTSGSLSNTTTISLTVQASTGLPPGWTDVDIGAVGLAGSATYNNGTFTVSGSGSDIWTAADQFNYAYQSVSGDQTVIARVVSENGNQSYAKAGVMIRETLATNAVEASTLLTPTNGVSMEVRPTTGASSINVSGWVKGPVPPQWVKLVRSGSTFTASYSADGNTWTQVASTNLTMATSATAGLAVTAHSNTNLNTANFDNVSIVGPTPDFTISATPSSQTVTAGNGTTYTATVGAVNGFNSSVSFSVSGLPTGASASFNPTSVTGSGSSTLTVSTATSTPAGTYTLTVTGTSGSLVHSTTVTLVVNPAPVPDFTISATPTSQTVTVGNGTTYTVTVGAVNGFNSSVSFSVSGLPTGASASFNPTSVTGSGSSTMTVSTATSTPAGTYTLTATGTSGSLVHSTTVTLVVSPAPVPDFTISATPSSQTVTVGNSTSYTATISPVNGFNSSVSFSVSGLPTGATGSFTPGSVTGSGSSTLNITTSSSTPVGTSTLTITGTSGGLVHSANVSFVVNPASSGGTNIYEAELLAIDATSGDTVQTNTQVGYSNGQAVQYNGLGVGDFITFRVPNVTAGTYTVIVGYKTYTTRGIVQVSAGTAGGTLSNVGSPFDEYGTPSAFTSINLGNWTATTTGDQDFEFSITGQNASSTGFTEVIDYVELIAVASPTTLSPIADAYVRDGASASSNFGTATNLDIKNSSSGFNRIAFLKFDLSTITTVSAAKLRLYGSFITTTGTSPVTAHQQLDNTWTETGITWNNMPAAGSAMTTVNVGTTAQYWEWDVTSYLQSQKSGGATQISFQLQNDTGTPQVTTFNSREAPSNNPQLVVTP